MRIQSPTCLYMWTLRSQGHWLHQAAGALTHVHLQRALDVHVSCYKAQIHWSAQLLFLKGLQTFCVTSETGVGNLQMHRKNLEFLWVSSEFGASVSHQHPSHPPRSPGERSRAVLGSVLSPLSLHHHSLDGECQTPEESSFEPNPGHSSRRGPSF